MANGYYGMSFEDRGPSPIPQDRPLVGGTTNVIDLSRQTPDVAISSDEQDDYQQFLTTTGRSDFNPYGDAGIFGAKVDFRNQLSPQRIAQINRQAFDQYRGLVSGQGTQRGGRGPRVPGYAPALKIGSDTPMGRVVAMPTTPRGGIADLASFFPGVSIIQGLLGGGNILRTLDDGGVDYSAEGVDAAMGTAPVQTAPTTVTSATTSIPSIRETVNRGIFESDDEAAAFEELTGVQTQVPVTTAEILATPSAVGKIPGYIDPVIDPNTGMVIQGTGVVPPQGPQVIQNIGTGDPGTATMSPRDVPIDTTVFPEDEAPIDLTAGVGEELLGTRSTAPINRSDDPAFARVLQSMLGPADVAQMRDRDARIEAIRIPLIAQGVPPALALKRAREQVDG